MGADGSRVSAVVTLLFFISGGRNSARQQFKTSTFNYKLGLGLPGGRNNTPPLRQAPLVSGNNKMTSDTIDIFDKEILATKKPFNFYLLISIFVGLSVLLFTVIIIRQLNFEGSFAAFIVFFIIAAIFYANFGQYLATIKLYGHRIEVNYLFPWNRSLVFKFDKLTELDYKDIPFQNGRQRWYVGGKWLYLKNEKKEVCQFKYNINNSADKILLEELSKKHS